MDSIENLIKRRAHELGFDLVGITTSEPFEEERDVTVHRINEGLMDGLPWFTKERVALASEPERLLDGAKSIITVGASYHNNEPEPSPKGNHGKFARYALGRDYHKVMKTRLRSLVRTLETDLQRTIKSRIFVDDGPMLDRAVAQRSGLGWYGKNTNILSPSHGSWIVLGQLITDLELNPDAPLKKTCGQCVSCIEICPTGAIVAPYVIDNRKCISYFTIECRGPIPRAFRPLIGDWVFGCDLCQEICPVNRKAQPGSIPELHATIGHKSIDLISLLELTDAGFLGLFQGTAIMRAKRVGLQRNVCVALGNLGVSEAVPALSKVLFNGELLLRGHAAWALGRIGGYTAKQAMLTTLISERDPWVREEIEAALQDIATTSNAHEEDLTASQ